MTDDDADDTLDLHAIGVHEAWSWATAVQLQARRILADPDADHVTRQIDAQLLALALRNVFRAAELALTDLTGHRRQAVKDAIENFTAAVPQFREARDALEHFDDYRQGMGDRQQPRVRRADRKPNPQAARQYATYYTRSKDGYTLTVGGWVIDVGAAERASVELVASLFNAGEDLDAISD